MTATYLSSGLEGSGGVLRSNVEDFVVRETLAYEPCGEGEHLFVEISKVGLTTIDAVHRLADATRARSRDVGYAGLKDKSATTFQWLSVPASVEVPLGEIAEGLTVLRTVRHKNKLKRSHGRSNRFEVTIRDVPTDGIDRARAVLAELARVGAPNTFGPQRFGRDGDNADRARAFLLGEERAPKNRRIKSLMISALQSKVFNRVFTLRIERGLWTTALAGDVMKKHDTGGLFDVTDPAAEQSRLERLEISPTAAMPGPKARSASGEAQSLEDQALADVGIDASLVAKLDVGTRRALRFPLAADDRIEAVGDDAYTLFVTLPSGAFATVLLAELMKPDGGEVLRSRDEDQD